MSTLERKEFQETKVMRTLSPQRNFRNSSQNLAEFDHNLDYMLEDLQNSVSRPGSSLGTFRESSRNATLDSNRSNSLNRFANVKSSNPVEYSSDDAYNYTSPDGSKKVSGFKKESYSVKTSGGGLNNGLEKNRAQNSINQLDSLLDDLQHVKNSSLIERESYNNIGSDPAFQSSKRSVHRELHYGDTPRSSSLTRDAHHYSSTEGTYGDLRQIRSTSPASRTSTLSKQTKVSNVHNYPLEVVETTTPDINPEILAHLDPNLHPPGNTKVTTTIKTYTYEIPGSGNYPTDLTLDQSALLDSSSAEKYIYSPNNQSQSTPSKSFVYKKTENNIIENTIDYPPPPPETTTSTWENKSYKESTDLRSVNYPAYQKPSPPGGHTIVKEVITTRNYQPGYSQELDNPPHNNNNNNPTYVYNEIVTTRNVDDSYANKVSSLPRNHPQPKFNRPPVQDNFSIKEVHDKTTNTVNNYYQPPQVNNQTTVLQKREIRDNQTNLHHHQTPHNNNNHNGRPDNDNSKTVIYRHESHTTNNYGGPDNNRRDVESFDPKHPPYGWCPAKPNEPVKIQYNYKSESKTTNNYKAGYPPGDDTQNLLPRPFPTDSYPDGPPKRLDELMANIGNEPPTSPYNASFTQHEIEIEQRKKVDTLNRQQAEAAEDLQRKEPTVRSKNISGPPVYYPPGHEMFAQKEEGGGAWRAEGAYARESGKYEYEKSGGEKSKSRSGAAIVPVCLPLCCGLPCTIL